jgi:hypothetical protein
MVLRPFKNMDNTNEPTVTIDIPSDPNATATMTVNPPVAQDAVITPEPLIVESNPQQEVQTVVPVENANPEAIQSQAVEANQPQNPESASTEAKPELSPSNPPSVEKNRVGRPCKYCQDKERLQKIVDDYLKLHQEAIKPTIPWIEELALKLGVDDYTFTLWAKKEKKGEKTEGEEIELEHPELSGAYDILKTLQKLRLKQRSIGRFNPHGSLYLLNADHKVIQTNKNVLANDEKGPLEIIITEEKKRAE